MKAGMPWPLVSTPNGFSDNRLSVMTPCARLADIKTIILGQSHNVALWRALVEPGENGARTRAMEIALELGLASLPHAKAVPDYAGAMIRAASDRNAVLLWSGSQFIADFLMMPGGAFDVVPRGYGSIAVIPDLPVVPETMIRTHFAPSVARVGELLGGMGRPSGLKRVVLGVPPPLGNDKLLREHMARRKGLFAAKAAELGVDALEVPLAPPSLRRKLWFILMSLYREEAERHGATFVPFPPAAADADGFLREELSAPDGVHGNVQYGRMMIEHLAPHLAEARH